MPHPMYSQHMRGLKQLERERPSDPGLMLIFVMANSALEKRLISGTATEADIQMLEAAATRAL